MKGRARRLLTLVAWSCAVVAAWSCAAAAVLLLEGCEGVTNEPDWERMIHQTNVRPYQEANWFHDQRAMRPPPLGAVPHDRIVGQPALTDGLVDNRYTTTIPMPVDRALLDTGRERFEIFCATCHGSRGDGSSEVATNMELRKPPSLIAQPALGFPPGRVYRVITEGYGLMPSYANELDLRQRWGVVAYLRALQLSQAARLAELPPSVRQAAEKALP